MQEKNLDKKLKSMVCFVSLACVLQIGESLIPHPIPGLRLGLANTITLITLVILGFRYAFQIALLRTLISSIIIGTFMSPAFILSFSAALVSTIVMGFLLNFFNKHKSFHLSLIGISIIGALFHNIVQMFLAYFILIKHKGIFVFLPWLCLGAVFTGWLTGKIAVCTCCNLRKIYSQSISTSGAEDESFVFWTNSYLPGNSFLHCLSANLKIIIIFFLALFILVFQNLWFYAGLFFFFLFIIASANVSFKVIFQRLVRFVPFVVTSFLLPVFFNSGEQVLYTFGYFDLTCEGINMGGFFAFRIILLILLSSLLIVSTQPEEMARGLAKILSPLPWIGASKNKIALVLTLSWMTFPYFWQAAARAILRAGLKKTKDFRKLIPLISGVITTLYLETKGESGIWENVCFCRSVGLAVRNVVSNDN